jgi:cyclophilin family peptidyl-prolyl cis-trans isomerase
MLALVCCFAFSACGTKSTVLEVSVNVYDSSKGGLTDKVLVVDLYDSVAPKTVSAIKQYAKEGYYNGQTFYLMTSFDGTSSYSSQIMFGDLTYNPDVNSLTLEQSAQKPFVEGEFEKAGVTGSNLKNEKGALGLWRMWQKGDSYKTSNWANTGSSVCYIPNSTIADYDGNFCVFGKIRLTNTNTAETWSKIYAACNNSSITSTFVIYYTGEYTTDDTIPNNGLTYHCLPLDDFEELTEEQKDEIFVAEDGQYVKYNETRVKIPLRPNGSGTKVSAASITSIKVK